MGTVTGASFGQGEVPVVAPAVGRCGSVGPLAIDLGTTVGRRTRGTSGKHPVGILDHYSGGS
jgi:hypothetical protein